MRSSDCDEPVNHEAFIKALFATEFVEQPLLPASLREKVETLEQDIADLKVSLDNLRSDMKADSQDHNAWFHRHISDLAAHAAKEFASKRDIECVLTALEQAEVNKRIEQAIEATFEREEKKLGQSIFNAIRNSIQPYALR